MNSRRIMWLILILAYAFFAFAMLSCSSPDVPVVEKEDYPAKMRVIGKNFLKSVYSIEYKGHEFIVFFNGDNSCMAEVK